jgi:hypothetical protein
MIAVDGAPKDNMYLLRYKSAGVVRNNGRKSWHVPYAEAVVSEVKYWWAEDYEL